MTRADLAFADSIRALSGWNQTLGDWERFLNSNPEGCFIAEFNGTPAGTVTTTRYGSELGWIGMLLVHPDRRQGGIGTALLHHAIASLQASGVRCIKLDATPAGQPIYERLGFHPEEPLTRCQAQTRLPVRPSPHVHPLKVSGSDWPAVVALDALAFGIERQHLLAELAKHARAAVVYRTQAGGLGYGMLREGARALYLGPAAADSPEAGVEVVRHLLALAEDQLVFWDVPDRNDAARTLAATLGLSAQRTLLRMSLRGATPPYRIGMQFGIVDPAVG